MSSLAAVNPSTRSGTIRIALIQFFFFTAWVIYALYLGTLLEKVGIDKFWLPWILLVDQVIFALMDPILGGWADRLETQVRQLAPFIALLNLLSGIAFMGLVTLGQGNMGVFLTLTFFWVATASVLRAPLYILLSRFTGAPELPVRLVYVLTAMAIGGAIAPFLGIWLKGLDPIYPFVVSSVVLIFAGFSLNSIPVPAKSEYAVPASDKRLPVYFLFTLLLALGFQLHAFVASGALYKQFFSADSLPLVLPIFWVGFNLGIFPASHYATVRGAEWLIKSLILPATLALLLCLTAHNAIILIAMQFVLGAVWGALFISATQLAMQWGRGGLALGGWFAMLSLATVARIALDKLSGLNPFVLEEIAIALWVVCGLFSWWLFKPKANLD